MFNDGRSRPALSNTNRVVRTMSGAIAECYDNVFPRVVVRFSRPAKRFELQQCDRSKDAAGVPKPEQPPSPQFFNSLMYFQHSPISKDLPLNSCDLEAPLRRNFGHSKGPSQPEV